MIPYDDLVVALTAWRARQGLPIAQPVAAAPPPPARGHAAPPAPTWPAAARSAAPQAPPPDSGDPGDSGDFDDSALVEDASYDASDPYMMQLGGEPQGEATEIGSVPEPPAPAPRRGKRPDGW
jgi:hypothetical protein